MHFFKEYVQNYNEKKEHINLILNDIESSLDVLLKVKNIKTLDECEEFIVLNKSIFENIENDISKIIENLNLLQNFCYDDIKNILPFIPEFKSLDDNQAFLKAKNIDYLIECIKNDKEPNIYEKVNLLEIAEFNKKVRYFIHTTMAIVENPSAFVIQKKLEKNIKEKQFIHQPMNLFMEVNSLMSEVYRIRRLLDQYHVLSNSSYGNWDSQFIEIKQIIDYLKIYKNRFEGFYFNENIYFIDIYIDDSTIQLDLKLNIPLDKVKEIIDVLLHNAADELVSKELALGKFDKKINCIIKESDNEIIISIEDNGRGFEDSNLLKPFSTTKNARFHNQGIGLDIANTNCMILSGKLEIENKENSGALFRLIFPKDIKANTEIFKLKINIAVFGKSKNTLKKLDELKEIHKDNYRFVQINSKEDFNIFLKNASLKAIDVVIIDNNEKNLHEEFKKFFFKGQLIIV
jgi:hypothetical protein